MTRNEKISAAIKASWADPVKRANRLAGINNSINLEQRAHALKARWADPVERDKLLATQNTPEQIQIKREAGRKAGNTPAAKAALLRGARAPKKGEKVRRNSENHAKALNVIFRDPNNKIWHVKNVLKFVREHEHLFSPEDVVWRGKKLDSCKMVSAFAKLTRNVDRRSSSKGWTLVSKTETFYNEGEDLIERQQHEIHSI
jgi:hypothetical protein